MTGSAPGADGKVIGVCAETLTRDAQELARLRGAAPAHRTERFHDDPNTEDEIGAAGELFVAHRYGLTVEMCGKPHGDGGYDFAIHLQGKRRTIDVKTGRSVPYLLVKVNDMPRCADILILCKYQEGKVRIVGWEHKGIMCFMPVRDFGKGILSHFRPVRLLRNLDQLDDLMNRRDPEPR